MVKLTKLSDEMVVAEVIEDQEQYVELVRRYEKKLARYVKYLIGEIEAGEVVQESFFKAFVLICQNRLLI